MAPPKPDFTSGSSTYSGISKVSNKKSRYNTRSKVRASQRVKLSLSLSHHHQERKSSRSFSSSTCSRHISPSSGSSSLSPPPPSTGSSPPTDSHSQSSSLSSSSSSESGFLTALLSNIYHDIQIASAPSFDKAQAKVLNTVDQMTSTSGFIRSTLKLDLSNTYEVIGQSLISMLLIINLICHRLCPPLV